MKKIISLQCILAMALIALTMHKSHAYDIILTNETDFDARMKVVNAACKDEERQVAAQTSTNKIGNGICNVRYVEADVKNVPLISLFEFEHSAELQRKEPGFSSSQTEYQEPGQLGSRRTERSRGMRGQSEEESSLYTQNVVDITSEQMHTQTGTQRAQQSQQRAQQRGGRGTTKNIVKAIEYKGPRTGTTTDTYVLKEKKDSQGNPIPQINKNNKGELVTLSGAIVRDSKNAPITENDGKFFNNNKEDITADLTDTMKRQIVATPTFEVIRK